MVPAQRLLWFRRAALAGALLAALVVVLGAWVRLTDAGLGCPDWPGCYGHPYPQAAQGFAKAWHEMIHRYFAGGLVTVTTLLLVLALANRRLPAQPLLPVVLLFVLIFAQAALGALTVTELLKPLIVTSHLLGGLSTLALLWWLALRPPPSLPAREAVLRAPVLLGAVVLAVQLFLGGWTSTNYAAVACPDLPTCQQSWWPAMDFQDAFVLWRGLDIDYTGGVLSNAARTAIHMTHRIGALVAGLTLIAVGVWAMARGSGQRRALGVLVVAAVLLQISIGLGMVRLGLPLAVTAAHNAGAALLVIVMTALARSLWPAQKSGVIP